MTPEFEKSWQHALWLIVKAGEHGIDEYSLRVCQYDQRAPTVPLLTIRQRRFARRTADGAWHATDAGRKYAEEQRWK